MSITIISFGHLQAPHPTDAHLVVDLRSAFHNPRRDLPPSVVYPDPRVIDQVLATAGIPALIDSLVTTTDLMATHQQSTVVAIGCAGGHHRAPTVADQVEGRLRSRGHQTTLTHRDLHTPTDNAPLTSGLEVDFPLAAPARSTEDPAQARARLEALASAWIQGFTAPQLAEALADGHGLTRSRSWVLTELRRLESDGLLSCDDSGRWTPTT